MKKGRFFLVFLVITFLGTIFISVTNVTSYQYQRRVNVPIEELSIFNFSTSEDCVEEWILDGNTIKKTENFSLNHSLVLNFSLNDVGYHNLTAIVTDRASLTSSLTWIMYAGTLFKVAENTQEIKTEIENIIAAPGEFFNITVKVSPVLLQKPAQIILEGSKETPLLLEPDEEGEYWVNWTSTENNSESTIFNLKTQANKTNSGEFALTLYRPAAEDDQGNPVEINLSIASVRISPRYDVNADFVVNIQDLTLIRRAIYTGFCVYGKRCDVNDDGVVNMIDFNIAKQHLGKIETVND